MCDNFDWYCDVCVDFFVIIFYLLVKMIKTNMLAFPITLIWINSLKQHLLNFLLLLVFEEYNCAYTWRHSGRYHQDDTKMSNWMVEN